MSSDEELIAAYRASPSGEMLDELVRRHLRRVRALVFQMVLDDAAADDLTQEVFLRVFRHLASFNGRSRFSTWLYRVAMNTTHSYLASQRRSRVESWDDLPPQCDRAATPERALLDAELGREVQRALEELPSRLRAAIVLTVLQGLDAKEAARIEGCTVATMYWRVHQARKRLARRLEEYLS